MASLRKSHSNYILRRKRQLTSKGAIYERDWMTVSELDGFAPGTLPVYASGNFKMTINADREGKKKYSFSNWALTDEGTENWTLNDIKDEELKIKSELVHPNYSSILDFAYYGSAVELIRGTANDIIMRYPAELYTTNRSLTYATLDGEFEELKNLVENPFMIDVFRSYVKPESVDNQYRYMALSWDKYEAIDDSGNTYQILEWRPGTPNRYACKNGDHVFDGAKIIIDNDCKDVDTGRTQPLTGSVEAGCEVLHIPIGNKSDKYYPAMQTIYKDVFVYNKRPENLEGTIYSENEVDIPMGNDSQNYYPELQRLIKDVYEYNNPDNYLTGTMEDCDNATIPIGNKSTGYSPKMLTVSSDRTVYGDGNNAGETALVPITELTPIVPGVALEERVIDYDTCDAITLDGILVNGQVYLVSDKPGYHIRLKEVYIDEIFDAFDDFEKVLLNRDTKPKYKAKFYTPRETPNGVITHEVAYVWPTLSGGWNLDFLSQSYESYLNGLLYIANYYDECRSDNIWRSYTHESIKNFDWTTPRDTYVPEMDGHLIDTERMEGILRVCGRQFDDLKRYIENIKFTINVSYDSKNNMPDKNMAKFLEMNGWEVKNVSPINDNSLLHIEEYPGKSVKVRPEDSNLEFLKRMILNSRNILSKKGTRAGIEAMYSMFGIFDLRYGETMEYSGNTETVGYTIEEYDVFVNNYITDYAGDDEKSDYDKIIELNSKKDSYQKEFDKEGDELCGLMVGRIVDDSGVQYIVPWYDMDLFYDGYPYYQMLGGWSHRERKDVLVNFGNEFVVNTQLLSDSGCSPDFSIFDETVKNIKVVDDFATLNSTPIGFLKEGDIYYVLNIKGAYDFYECPETDVDSHYVFFTGSTSYERKVPYSEDYNWCMVPNSAFDEEELQWYAKKILYMESIHDVSIGNNPHNGNGIYDLGRSYFDYYRQIFKGSLDNKEYDDYHDKLQAANAKRHYDNRFRTNKLPDLPDITVDYHIEDIGFDFSGCTDDYYNDFLVNDNSKVWYFLSYDSGIYNGGILSKKPVGDNYFILTRNGTRDTTEYTQVTKENFPIKYEAKINQNAPIRDTEAAVVTAEESLGIPQPIKSLTDNVGPDELWSYSAINTKNIRITYYLPWEMEDYVTNVVEFYVKQLIPSTVIVDFKWVYTADGERPGPIYNYSAINLTPEYQSIRSYATTAEIGIKSAGVTGIQIDEETTETS